MNFKQAISMLSRSSMPMLTFETYVSTFYGAMLKNFVDQNMPNVNTVCLLFTDPWAWTHFDPIFWQYNYFIAVDWTKGSAINKCLCYHQLCRAWSYEHYFTVNLRFTTFRHSDWWKNGENKSESLKLMQHNFMQKNLFNRI